jgi:hypothetical protein
MPKTNKETITQKQLREVFDGAAGVDDEGNLPDAGVERGVAAIRALIEDGKISKAQGRNLFAWYAENGYDVSEGWQMLAELPTRRSGSRGVSVGDKVNRVLKTGKNGRKGMYLPMGCYDDCDEVAVSYSKGQVLIKGLTPIEAEG